MSKAEQEAFEADVQRRIQGGLSPAQAHRAALAQQEQHQKKGAAQHRTTPEVAALQARIRELESTVAQQAAELGALKSKGKGKKDKEA